MGVAASIAAPAMADRGTDDLAAYARARAADQDGRVQQAAAGYAAALAGSPENVAIARRAYREALKAGDYALADRAATVMDMTDSSPPDAALLAYARAVRARDSAGIAAALKNIDAGPFDFVAGLLRAWAAYDGGGDPFAHLGDAKANPVARRYIAENRALLLVATGKIDQGAIALQALLGTDQANLDLRFNAAQLLAGKGRPDISRALLAGTEPEVVALRENLGRGVAPTGAYGASRLFTRLATDLAPGDSAAIVIALSRVALRLEPGNDRALILLAQALSRSGASERALATLSQIQPGSPFREAALQARVTILNRAGEAAAALAEATSLSGRKDASSADAARVGDLLFGAGRFEEAARSYALAIARAGDTASWMLYLQHGGALDEAGHWPEARASLEKAVALAPGEPVVLNYLGYARLEHGEDAAASIALLERASALQPDDASITDSLAWAYFQRGDTKRALPLLERAARGEPANATINEHLGDAYWSLGRRYEARYAWQAAQSVANTEDGARLAGKIADGIRGAP